LLLPLKSFTLIVSLPSASLNNILLLKVIGSGSKLISSDRDEQHPSLLHHFCWYYIHWYLLIYLLTVL